MKDDVGFVMFKPFYECEVVVLVNMLSFQIEFFFSSSDISLMEIFWKMACSLALKMGKKRDMEETCHTLLNLEKSND